MGLYCPNIKKVITLYNNGVEHASGIDAYSYVSSGIGSTPTAPILVKHDNYFEAYTIKTATAGSIFINEPVLMTGKTKLCITTTLADYDDYIYLGVSATKTNQYIHAAVIRISGAGTFKLDVSALSEKYYVSLLLGGRGTQKVNVTRWWLE